MTALCINPDNSVTLLEMRASTLTHTFFPCPVIMDCGTESPNTFAPHLFALRSWVSECNFYLCAPAACNVWYLCSVEMESLTGVQAVQKATSMTLSSNPPPTSTVVHFKVSSQGITLTDNQRKWVPHRHIHTINTCTDPFLTITTPCLLLGSSSGGITMSIRSYFAHWTLKIESEYCWFTVWTFKGFFFFRVLVMAIVRQNLLLFQPGVEMQKLKKKRYWSFWKWNSVQQTTIILFSMLTGGKKMAALQQSKYMIIVVLPKRR